MTRGRDPHGGEVGCTGRPAWFGREVPYEGSRKFIRAGMIAFNRSPSKVLSLFMSGSQSKLHSLWPLFAKLGQYINH